MFSQPLNVRDHFEYFIELCRHTGTRISNAPVVDLVNLARMDVGFVGRAAITLTMSIVEIMPLGGSPISQHIKYGERRSRTDRILLLKRPI
jgi:hypothetical protein